MAAKFVLQTWTNLTKLKMSLKNIASMAKRACGKYLEVVLRNAMRGATKRDYVSL
jgi:alkylhydroperoxidase/carboxymuconolactone decarboxylase family protein YurZ